MALVSVEEEIEIGRTANEQVRKQVFHPNESEAETTS